MTSSTTVLDWYDIRDILILLLASQMYSLSKRLAPNFIRAHFNPTSFVSSSATATQFHVLYEDEHFIAINKPYNVLSVPGKVEVFLGSRLPRSEEWICSIVAVNNIPNVYDKLSSSSRDILSHMVGKCNIPRKENGFYKYLQNNFYSKGERKDITKPVVNTVEKLDICMNELWNSIIAVDKMLHEVSIDKIPQDERSVATILSHELNCKLYHVHRYEFCNVRIIFEACWL